MRRACPSAQGRSSGFTLIELMTVVLIIGMIMTSFTMKLDSLLPSTRGEEAGRQIIASLDQARLASISYGRSYAVEFDLDLNRYRTVTPFDEDGVLARDPEERVSSNWSELPDGVTIAGIFDHTEEVVEEGKYLLAFTPLGGAEELYVQIENDAGDSYTLTVYVQALTGHSKIIRGVADPAVVTEDDL